MKIAVLSDIHGNASALIKVLAEAKRNDVQQLLILGDIVGYYYHPNIVLEKLSEWECHWVFGNHEILLQSFIDGDESVKQQLRKKYGSGFDHCIEKLSREQLLFIKNLLEVKDVLIERTKIKLCHGTPWDYNEYLYPDASKDKLNQCNEVGLDFVLMGHTHYPFVYKGNDTLIANVGSVGQSRVMGGIANWSIINTSNKTYTAKYTPYDVKDLKKEAQKNNPELPYLWEILDRNRI